MSVADSVPVIREKLNTNVWMIETDEFLPDSIGKHQGRMMNC